MKAILLASFCLLSSAAFGGECSKLIVKGGTWYSLPGPGYDTVSDFCNVSISDRVIASAYGPARAHQLRETTALEHLRTETCENGKKIHLVIRESFVVVVEDSGVLR